MTHLKYTEPAGAQNLPSAKVRTKVSSGYGLGRRGRLLSRRLKGLKQAQSARTTHTLFLHQMQVPDGPTYPLRRAMVVYVLPSAGGYRAESRERTSLPGLWGSGHSRKAAVAALATRLQELVEANRLPPHERSEENRRVNIVLDQLVDWDRYKSLNPVNQPLWGRVTAHNPDGSVSVHWFIGPNGEEDTAGVLAEHSVHRALRAFDVGEWFYGSGRVFPEKIDWARAPERVPDPQDQQAVRDAWDLIPTERMGDPEAWPVKAQGTSHGGA